MSRLTSKGIFFQPLPIYISIFKLVVRKQHCYSDPLPDRSVTKFYIKSFWFPNKQNTHYFNAYSPSFPEVHKILDFPLPCQQKFYR